jgi:hypothetical protein
MLKYILPPPHEQIDIYMSACEAKKEKIAGLQNEHTEVYKS